MLKLLIVGLYVLVAAVIMAAGSIVGRKAVFARPLAGYGTPAALLLSLVLLLLWREEAGRLSGTEEIIVTAVPALSAAAAASFCAFRPVRMGFLMAFAAGIMGAFCTLFRIFPGMVFSRDVLAAATIYGFVLLLSVMGLTVGKKKEQEPVRKEEGLSEEPKHKHSETVQPAGSLILMAEPFSGQRIPLSDGEELRLGSDAVYCHLILDLPGIQPCLCGIRWLERRNTYLVTCYAHSGLLYEDGRPLPCNSSMEVKPGNLFLYGQTGQALFQAG